MASRRGRVPQNLGRSFRITGRRAVLSALRRGQRVSANEIRAAFPRGRITRITGRGRNRRATTYRLTRAGARAYAAAGGQGGG